jgi:hypothetical protein
MASNSVYRKSHYSSPMSKSSTATSSKKRIARRDRVVEKVYGQKFWVEMYHGKKIWIDPETMAAFDANNMSGVGAWDDARHCIVEN